MAAYNSCFNRQITGDDASYFFIINFDPENYFNDVSNTFNFV